VARSPHVFGLGRSRWTLALLAQACPELARLTPSGIRRLLTRHRITWRRARSYIHSPDPDYAAKLAAVAACVAEAAASGGQIVVLYQDEVTLERQPSLAASYAPMRTDAPRADRSQRSNTLTRYTATLDAADARVCFVRASHVTVPTLVRSYQRVVAVYPEAVRIYIVQDNWPVHVHPDVLVALEPQESPFPRYTPPHWPEAPSATALRRWGHLQLPIQLVPLPTYASWCNPIEKLWRWLRQDLGHLHPWADDLDQLRAAGDQFLAQFEAGSPALLRYVGLEVDA
jgi:hypothetical protein